MRPEIARVIKASRLLRAESKLLLLEVGELQDGAEGVSVGASALAQRLGRGREAVVHTRVVLAACGLLAKRQGPGRTGRWAVTVPATCIPTSAAPTDIEVAGCAARLDGYLGGVRVTGGPDAASPDRRTGDAVRTLGQRQTA